MKQYNYKHVQDFTLNMVTEAVEEANKSDKYKELDKNISNCKDKLRSHIDDNAKVELDKLFELFDMKQLITEESLYKAGFRDGMVFLEC